MGNGFPDYQSWIRFQNSWIMNLPQEEFDKYCDKIVPDIDTSNYVGD